MSSAGNGERYFRIHLSAALASELKRLQRRASREGRGAALLDAYHKMIQRLTSDPWNFGEPAYGLPAMRLQVRHAIIRPLRVDFAISELWPLVFIKGVKLLSR